MKKIFTLIAALTLCVGLFAQAGETELFVAANASVDHTWGQFDNPEATWNAQTGVLTVEITQQGEWQWGNQVFLNTGITTLGTDKEYQVSFDIVASTENCGGVTFKAFDDTQIAMANQNIAVTDQVQTWTSEWTKAPAATADGLMVWDFGWDPVQTITISNISIKERDAQAPAPVARKEFVFVAGEAADAEPVMFAITWGADDSSETVKMTNKEKDIYVADILPTMDSVVLVRCATGATEIIWDGEGMNVWNQSEKYPLSDKMSFGGWSEEGFIILTSPEPVEGDQFVDATSGLKFEVAAVGEANTMKVMKNDYTGTSYTVPATVSYQSVTFNVTEIGKDAFEECSSLESVTIPASVTTIGQEAFHKCPSLASITIPAGVTAIGVSAFAECAGLTSVTFLGNACQESVGDLAFDRVGSTTPATLVLPANWTGTKPDEDGNWYGGKFELSEVPTVDKTGITVNGRKYGFPVRLVKEVK